MKKIISQILKMPYHKNYAATSGAVHNIAKHEDAVEDSFVNNRLKEWNPSSTKKGKKSPISKKRRNEVLEIKQFPEMPDNSYISQPCGTHNSPDFIVKCKGKIYMIECKSAKGGTPMYNSGVPTSEYVYIFTSEKHNATTAYWGEDVLDIESKRLIEEHIAKARRQDEKLNKLLVDNGHGITYYTRPMIQHKGTKFKKDYFLNPERSQLEKRVLNGV